MDNGKVQAFSESISAKLPPIRNPTSQLVMSSQHNLFLNHRILVRTYDIDSAGHVSNIAYLRWLEDMRLELFEKYFPLRDFVNAGIKPVIASTHIEYKRPIKLFDRPEGFMWVSEMGRASLIIEAELRVDSLVTTVARHVGVFVMLDTGKPIRVPEVCRAKFAQGQLSTSI